MIKIVKSLSIIMAVVAVIVGGTYAYFTDTATSNTNTFSSGTLSINNGKLATTSLTIPNIAPGQVSNEYSVIIENNGDMDLAWLGDWQFDGGLSSDNNYDLKNALYIADAKMEFLKSDNSTVWLDEAKTSELYTNNADIFIKNGIGNGPYPAAFNALATTSPFGVVSFNKWNNNSSMVTTGTYEHAGALRPGYAYKLTVKFGMAAGAGNQYQNLGPVTAKLKVDATQIDETQIKTLTGGWADVAWMNRQIADQTE